MSLGPIPRNFISIVTFQSLLLRGFERLVFRSPTVLEKPLARGRFVFISSIIISQRPTDMAATRSGTDRTENVKH
jgi:hypothetical protein